MSAAPILEVQGLSVQFRTRHGVARVLENVSFALPRGGTLGLVGESGCGKSVTALAAMRLIPAPPGRIDGGKVLLDGRDLLALPEQQMREVRGNRVSMIFQEPMTSLNPAYTVGDQIGEAVRLHQGASKRAALDRATEMLAAVGIPSPAQRVHEYPHQLSGGMRQRVMIALAMACSPTLLIADEPTTALDVTIQAQILDLLRKLQKDLGMSMLFITHNLGVVAEIAQEIAVMYAGRVVEQASVSQLFSAPRHPYTQALIRCIPRIDAAAQAQYQTPGFRLPSIRGVVPHASAMPAGCAFSPRCDMAMADCELQMPSLELVQPGQASRCIRWRELEGQAA